MLDPIKDQDKMKQLIDQLHELADGSEFVVCFLPTYKRVEGKDPEMVNSPMVMSSMPDYHHVGLALAQMAKVSLGSKPDEYTLHRLDEDANIMFPH